MSIELEAKVKVDDFAAVEAALAARAAQPLDSAHQVDIYYDFPDSSLLRIDAGLRIRHEKQPDGIETVLCYKGPRQPGPYKQREELETAVADYETLQAILERLGFVIRLSIEKTRRHWRLNDCLVCLDEVTELGRFVEIEGPGEAIIRLTLNQLGLAGYPCLKFGYARMMAEKRMHPEIE